MIPVFNSIARQLENQAFALSDQFLDSAILSKLQREAMEDYEEGEFKRAAIGKGIEKKAVA